MNEQLQQSAGDVLDKLVKGASVSTGGLGLGTLADIIPDVLGCVSMLVGIFVTLALYRKKNKLLDMQIAESNRNGDDHE